MVPALAGRQPSPSLGCWPRPRPLSADCLVAAGPRLPPGHESDPHPGVSVRAGASIPAGCRRGAHTSRAGGLQGTESPASNTSEIHRAALLGSQGRNTQADEEQNPSSITGWKNGSLIRLPLGLGGIWAMAVTEGSVPQVLPGLEMFS